MFLFSSWASLDPFYWDTSPSEKPLCPSKILLIYSCLNMEITIYVSSNQLFRTRTCDVRFANESLFLKWSNVFAKRSEIYNSVCFGSDSSITH